MSISSAFEEE